MIELGGNIKLEGFDNIEPAKLIVIKKIVGFNTKKISEANKDFKEILVTLKSQEPYEIEVKITADKETLETEKDENLFYCLDKVFAKILK